MNNENTGVDEVWEEVKETVRLLSSEDKRRILEMVGEHNLNGMEESLPDRGYTFVRKTFLGFEELDLIEREDDYGDAELTSEGRQVLEARERFDADYRDTVRRFFENELDVQDADFIHDIVDLDGMDLRVQVPGLPEEFLRMPDMLDFFHSLDPHDRLDNLADEYDLSEPSVRKRLQTLERHGMVNEKKVGRNEKAFFYGPFAFPVLKMTSRIEDIKTPDQYVFDWRKVVEEEQEREGEGDDVPYFTSYSEDSERQEKMRRREMEADFDPRKERSSSRNIQAPTGSESRGFFQAWNGVGPDYLTERTDLEADIEDWNQDLDDGEGVYEVAAVNNDSIVLKGGYIWNDYSEQPVEEGDYLFVREKGSAQNSPFEEVEPLGKVDPEEV